MNLPEPVPAGSTAERLGFPTVSDVTTARLRAVLEGGLSAHGLRVLNLGASNFAITAGLPGEWMLTECTLTESTLAESNRAREHRNWPGITMEVLVAERVGPEEVWSHRDAAGVPVVMSGGVAVVLTDLVTAEVARAAVELQPRVLVFLEDGLAASDALKVNIVANALSRGITVKTV